MKHKKIAPHFSMHQFIYATVFSMCCFFSITSQAIPFPTKTISPKRIKSISQFIHYVWKTNPAIQAAQSEVNSANAEFSQSKQAVYNPDLIFEGEHVAKDPHENTYTAGISQTIDLSNKRGARTKVGRYSFAQAKANLSQQKLALATETLKALAEYRASQSAVKLARRRTQLLREFNVLNARKLKSGDIAQDASDLAALAYAEAISQQAEEEVILTQARQSLLQITHISATHWPQLKNRLPKPLDPPARKQKQWLTDLPLIQLYNARVSVAKGNVLVAKAQTKIDPTLSLAGGEEDNSALVNASLSFPIFVRNNFQDQVRAANQQEIAIEQSRMNVYRKVSAALQGDLYRYRILYHATINWHQAAKRSLSGGMQLLNRLWSAGELSTTDYIIQVKQRIDSQIAGVELKGKAWKMWFSTLASAGKLNNWLEKN